MDNTFDFLFSELDDGTYCVTKYMGEGTTPVVPAVYQDAPVTIIADDVFKGRPDITQVTLPDTVTDIGGFAFDSCFSLKSIVLPGSLQNMWQYAFARSGIEEMTVPDGVRMIVPFTFMRCPVLHRIVLPKGLTAIYGNAFKDCPNLTEIVLPRSCEIHETAFDGCPKVPFIYI